MAIAVARDDLTYCFSYLCVPGPLILPLVIVMMVAMAVQSVPPRSFRRGRVLTALIVMDAIGLLVHLILLRSDDGAVIAHRQDVVGLVLVIAAVAALNRWAWERLTR